MEFFFIHQDNNRTKESMTLSNPNIFFTFIFRVPLLNLFSTIFIKYRFAHMSSGYGPILFSSFAYMPISYFDYQINDILVVHQRFYVIFFFLFRNSTIFEPDKWFGLSVLGFFHTVVFFLQPNIFTNQCIFGCGQSFVNLEIPLGWFRKKCKDLLVRLKFGSMSWVAFFIFYQKKCKYFLLSMSKII